MTVDIEIEYENLIRTGIRLPGLRFVGKATSDNKADLYRCGKNIFTVWKREEQAEKQSRNRFAGCNCCYK